MKPLIICTAFWASLFLARREAKGCIKAPSLAACGPSGGARQSRAVAGCIIGRHEANKQDADRPEQKTPPSTHRTIVSRAVRVPPIALAHLAGPVVTRD